MDGKKIKIYTASSVGIDYYFFLNKVIEQAGYEVIPLFLISEANYRRKAKAGGLDKIWLRIQMYLIYPLYLIYKGILAKRDSVFIISSNTFYAPCLVKAVVQFKKGKVIQLLYDLFPDAIEIAGSIKVNSAKSNFIGKITKLNQLRCNATAYLGEFLKHHAETRWGEASISKVIDISTDLDLYNPIHNTELTSEKLIVHYGGQLGHLHDAVSIIESIKFIYNSDLANKVEFNFYVSGAQAQLLKNSLKNYPVNIISAIPSNQWREDIRNFHVGLVSLSPGGETVCLPSKTYAMMAGGMAIITICPVWSDLSILVNDLDAGWIINNSHYNNRQDLYHGDYLNNITKKRALADICQSFYETLSFIINNNDVLIAKRENAFNNVREKFNISALSKQWRELIEEC